MYDLAHKYSFCLFSDPQHNMEAYLLLLELENYANGAIMQITRIDRTRKAIEKKLQGMKFIKDDKHIHKSTRKDFALTRLHCDTHFYFICIGQINKLLKRLCEVLNDCDLKVVYHKFTSKFNKDIRDDLEHLDERAVGKKKRQYIGHITDFCNFPGDSFSFNGKQYPVNKGSVKELTQIYKEVIDVLYKNYGSKDPHFVWMEQSERQSKELFRYLKKQGSILPQK